MPEENGFCAHYQSFQQGALFLRSVVKIPPASVKKGFSDLPATGLKTSIDFYTPGPLGHSSFPSKLCSPPPPSSGTGCCRGILSCFVSFGFVVYRVLPLSWWSVANYDYVSTLTTLCIFSPGDTMYFFWIEDLSPSSGTFTSRVPQHAFSVLSFGNTTDPLLSM